MLHYEIEGKGSEDLVLLHGFMENLTIWEEMKVFLSDQFRLIKIDLPGHGKSKVYSEVHTMEFNAEKIKEVTDFLALENFHLLGHSMGGYTALAFAELFPKSFKSLTLFFSTFFPDDDEKKEFRSKSLRIIKEAFPAYVQAGVPNLFNPIEKDILAPKIELAKKIALSTNNDGVLAAVKGMIERPDRKQVLENLESKIVVIAGKHDITVNTALTLEHLPERTNIKSYLIDCAHNGQWERPQVCAAILNTELLSF